MPYRYQRLDEHRQIDRPHEHAGLRDPMANLTGPGPERYHAKPRIARRRLSEPGYRHRHFSLATFGYTS
jgi:hypothetical protein